MHCQPFHCRDRQCTGNLARMVEEGGRSGVSRDRPGPHLKPAGSERTELIKVFFGKGKIVSKKKITLAEFDFAIKLRKLPGFT